MAKFITRVLLKKADSDDYDNLYEAMRQKGFSKFISAGDGTKYELPPAEYSLEGSIDRGAVLDRATTAAKSTGLAYSILVTESAGRT